MKTSQKRTRKSFRFRALKMFVLAVSFAAVISICLTPALSVDKYILEVPIPKGITIGSLPKMLSDLMLILSKKTNTQIEVRQLVYGKGEEESAFQKMMSDLKTGKSDIVLVNSPFQLAKAKDKALSLMTPFMIMKLNNSAQGEVCFYVKRDSPYKSVKELKGKRWGGTYTMHTRYLMHAAGIDVPVSKFFGSVKYIDDTNLGSIIDELLAGSIDTFTSAPYLYEMVKGAKKQYATDVKELGCKEYEHSWIFAHGKSFPVDLADKIRTIMLSSNKDKDFAQFRFMLAAIKGQFAPYDPKAMATTEKIAALMVKYGWEKEQSGFIKTQGKSK